MTFTRLLDEIGVRNMWFYRRPPVETTPEEALRLARTPDEQLHVPATAAVLTPVSRAEANGVREEHFIFPSQRPSGHTAVDVAWCIRWSRPGRTWTGRRALVLVHGAYTSSLKKPLLYVPAVADAEWDTIALELPHHLRRQRNDSLYSGAFLVTADVTRITRGILQAECDIRALVLGLRALGYRQIVLGGISIGASPVMQSLIRVDVEGAFGIVPSVDAYMGLWDSLLGRGLRPAGYRAGLDDRIAGEVLRTITPARLGRPRIAPEKILMICGRHDQVCRLEETRGLERAWGPMTVRIIEDGHASLIMRYPRIRRTIGAWMRRRLR